VKLHYYPETDSLYVELADAPAADSKELVPGIVADYDASGRLVGLDVDHASTAFDLGGITADVDGKPVGSLRLLMV